MVRDVLISYIPNKERRHVAIETDGLSCALSHDCVYLRHRSLQMVRCPLSDLVALADILIATSSYLTESLLNFDTLPVSDLLVLYGRRSMLCWYFERAIDCSTLLPMR